MTKEDKEKQQSLPWSKTEIKEFNEGLNRLNASLNIQTSKRAETKSRYKKEKLSAETVCVIKKALTEFKTKELESERISTLATLNKTNDFFIVMYTRKRK